MLFDLQKPLICPLDSRLSIRLENSLMENLGSWLSPSEVLMKSRNYIMALSMPNAAASPQPRDGEVPFIRWAPDGKVMKVLPAHFTLHVGRLPSLQVFPCA